MHPSTPFNASIQFKIPMESLNNQIPPKSPLRRSARLVRTRINIVQVTMSQDLPDDIHRTGLCTTWNPGLLTNEDVNRRDGAMGPGTTR
jgi:hypothetical protein